MKGDFLPVLVILGFGGIVIYMLTRSQPIATAPVVAPPQQQCGASYAGTGVSVPCSLIGEGVKDLYNDAQKTLSKYGVTQTVKAGTKGFTAVDVIEAPVALNHAIYNYAKAGYDKLASWL